MKLRLYPSADQALQLQKMVVEYQRLCNLASQWVFDNGFPLGSFTLNKALYNDYRKNSALNSQMVQSVFRTVTARYKTVHTQFARKPYHYQAENGTWQNVKRDVTWLWKPVKFIRPQADFVRRSNWSFVKNGTLLSLTTLGKRIKMSFSVKGFDDLMSWHFGTAKLVKTCDHWFLHVSVTKQVADFDRQAVSHVVGINRGLRFLATSYDNKGKTQFFDGKVIMRKRDKFKRLRQQLQMKNTPASKRRLRKINQRENRWMSDVNHRISKALVKHYGKQTLFVVENLTGVSFERDELSKNQRNKICSWAFYQFEQFLTYKAAEQQSQVLSVSPKYTSQRCPKCGVIRKLNRDHHIHEYICKNCGYHSNDDRIGAMNLYQLGTDYVSGVDKPAIEILKTNSD